MYGSLFYVLPILAVIAKTVFRAVLPLLIGIRLLQPSTERRILCGFGLLQVSRSISSAEVFQ